MFRVRTARGNNIELRERKFQIPDHFDDRVGESLRRFQRQIVTDSALDDPVGVSARKLLRIRTDVRVST